MLYHMHVDLENKVGPANLARSPLQILDMTVGKPLTKVGAVEWERTSKSESLEIKGKGEIRDRDDQWESENGVSAIPFQLTVLRAPMKKLTSCDGSLRLW